MPALPRPATRAETPTDEPTDARPTDAGPTAGARVPRSLVGLLAVACGLAVANLYYAQPLLDVVARDLHTSEGTAGLALVTTQLGYAAGLAFVVPLGDLVDRRRLVTGVLVLTTLSLAAAALAPGIGALAAALAAVGLTSVVVQILVPFAATLAADDERGTVVGTVMSGLLIGILLARTLSGAIAAVGGWRSVFVVAAVLMAALAVVLRLRLPQVSVASDLRYPAALASVLTLVRTHPVLRRRMLFGALAYGAFSVFWTSVAFLLASPPYGWSEAQTGLLGLVGLAGALCAQVSGRLADRGHGRAGTGGWLALVLLSFGVLALGGSSLAALVVGVLLLDAGVQGAQILNQSAIYALDGQARSRITTAYMTCTFLGGAAGSALSAVLYASAGWGGVCAAGAVVAAVALLAWATDRSREPADARG